MNDTTTFKLLIIFKDLEANKHWNICIDDNGATLGRCVYACDSNESCENECLDSFKIRQADCPCEVPLQISFHITYIIIHTTAEKYLGKLHRWLSMRALLLFGHYHLSSGDYSNSATDYYISSCECRSRTQHLQFWE